MEKVKLSTLSKDTIVLVDGYSTIFEVSEILEDLDKFKHKKIYTTKEYNAKFNARDVLEDAIEYEYQNMYEDWNEQIWQEVTEQDINDLQVILDRILSRSGNIAYIEDKLIEFDIEEEQMNE